MITKFHKLYLQILLEQILFLLVSIATILVEALVISFFDLLQLLQTFSLLLALILHTVDGIFFWYTSLKKLLSSLKSSVPLYLLWDHQNTSHPAFPSSVSGFSSSHIPVFQLYRTTCDSCCEMCYFMFPWICLLKCFAHFFLLWNVFLQYYLPGRTSLH